MWGAEAPHIFWWVKPAPRRAAGRRSPFLHFSPLLPAALTAQQVRGASESTAEDPGDDKAARI
jgi:hypothetical protein